MQANIGTKLFIQRYEFLFALYFWGFLLLRPVLLHFGEYSTVILFFFVIILLLAFIGNMIIANDIGIGRAVFFILSCLIFFFVDALLRHNSQSFTYIYNFLIKGVLPVLFLSKVQDPELALKYFTRGGILTFLLYGWDPIGGFTVFVNYMDYGFSLAMPVFLGSFLCFYHLRMKWVLVFVILSFIGVLLFANKSALLTVVSFIVFYYYLFSKNRRFFLLYRVLPITIIGVITFIYLEPIINYIYDVAVNKFDINSYILNQLTGYFGHNDVSLLLSGRGEIWDNAKMMIRQAPIIGHGIGAFQAEFGYYAHSLYLDVLLFYGYIGLIIFASIFFYTLYRLFKFPAKTQVVALLFLFLWFPKLLFSEYFMEEIGFWCYFSYFFIVRQIHN